jgi:hypothetical protein
MESIIEKNHIICGCCNLIFERDKENRHCSNGFACTGCEIYYCPRCNNEIVITPVRSMSNASVQKRKTGKGRGKRDQQK